MHPIPGRRGRASGGGRSTIVRPMKNNLSDGGRRRSSQRRGRGCDMSLQDIQQALQTLAKDGQLTFQGVSQQVEAVAVVRESLPPLYTTALPQPTITLTADGQTLTVEDTITWGLLSAVGVKIVVTPDPTTSGAYSAQLAFTLPASATLTIPGLPWFSLSGFEIDAYTMPGDLVAASLAPASVVE